MPCEARFTIRQSALSKIYATKPLRNIKELEKAIYFRYEDFAERPEWTKAQILGFMLELQDLDITRSFKRHVRFREAVRKRSII
jgi:hypothetical protein